MKAGQLAVIPCTDEAGLRDYRVTLDAAPITSTRGSWQQLLADEDPPHARPASSPWLWVRAWLRAVVALGGLR